MFKWRSFQFFDKDLVTVKEDTANILQKVVINCTTSGRGHIIFGLADGCICIIDREWNIVTLFQAYNRSVTHIQQLKQSNVLVSVGDDEESISPTIKIWNLDKTDKKSGNPLCLKSIRVNYNVPVTAFVALEDLSQIAVGLASGIVVLMKGDIVREKTTKQATLTIEGQSPVTGLGFKEQAKSVVLFVVTSDSVHTFFTHLKENHHEVLDDHAGCGVGCAVLSDEQDLIVGRQEAIYFYEAEGRGPCFAFEGDKKLLSWFRSYLMVIGQDPNNLKFNTFSLYDLKNKFIAYSENRFQNITHVVSEWGSIFVFTGEGKIFQLEEKDTQTKLETLFKKNLYSVAINLAHSQNLDHASIIDIFRKYGDHLYLKGDYDGAIAQYIKTIGKLEPSYVIRKFLDAQRIHNLTSYLQALHEKGLANADHTTLLFNCYTKLKDVHKLDEFVKNDSELNFDVETAIKATRQAGYYEHALYLAKRHQEHESYLKILLEDLKNFTEALDYISTLDFFEAEKNLKKYGKNLITNLPEPTTNLLKRLCSNYQPTLSTSPNVPKPKDEDNKSDRSLLFVRALAVNLTSQDSVVPAPAKVKAVPDEFIHIFVNQPEWLIKFLEFIIDSGTASNLIYNTLLELYLRDETVTDVDTTAAKTEPTKDPNNNTPVLPKLIKRSLTSEEQKARRKKALDLLTNTQAKYDDDYALILCKLHDFRDGLLFLYEKLQLFHEIIEYYMENDEYDNILKACKKYGYECVTEPLTLASDKEPNLWVEALSYFAAKDKDYPKEIIEVLTNIDRENLLPPLLVIKSLSRKPTATLSLIKDYITKRLHTENQLIAEDSKQIKNYREETKKMRSEIQELKTSAKIFQLNKCTYCGSALDLPAVHFLCMHSFHQRCLSENEGECPSCAPQNKKILEIKRSLEENIGQHELFFKQLEGSPDGFNTVAEYFGRGIFNKVILLNPEKDTTRPKTTKFASTPGNTFEY